MPDDAKGPSRRRLILKCVVAFILAAAATLAYDSWGRFPRAVGPEEGFDFSEGVDENDPAEGPKLGERIDLSAFKGRGGESLKDAMRGKPAVLAIIDPECGMVGQAADEFSDMRQRLSRDEVGYYLIAFKKAPEPGKFYDYADSLGVGAPSFLWESSVRAAPSSFRMMVVPSHLLVDAEGAVLLKWSGTSPYEEKRRRMANQIILDARRKLKGSTL